MGKIIEYIMFKLVNYLPTHWILVWPIRQYTKMLSRYSYRPFVKNASNFFGDREITGIEIGVAAGTFSRMLLRKLNLKKLYLIDPYRWYDNVNFTINDLSKFKKQCKKKLKKYDNKTFIQLPSQEASELFKDESLDFIYIDGDHHYDFIKADIALYWPKVKKGGMLGGHDMDAEFLGVCRAVVEFANKNKLTICGNQNEWWIFKK